MTERIAQAATLDLGDGASVTSISDGHFLVEPSFLYANVEADELDRRFGNQILVPINTLLLNTPEKQVLFDAGFEDGATPTAGALVESLALAGVDPDSIDLVVFTHGHVDHVGGAAATGGGRRFPNATYAMWHTEHDFWMAPGTFFDAPEFGERVRQAFSVFEDDLTLVQEEGELAPGVRVVHAPGHTLGQMAFEIAIGSRQLLHLADVVIQPEIGLEQMTWHPLTEMLPRQGVETRRAFAERAANEGTLTFACHAAFPGFGRVVRRGSAFEWVPLLADELIWH